VCAINVKTVKTVFHLVYLRRSEAAHYASNRGNIQHNNLAFHCLLIFMSFWEQKLYSWLKGHSVVHCQQLAHCHHLLRVTARSCHLSLVCCFDCGSLPALLPSDCTFEGWIPQQIQHPAVAEQHSHSVLEDTVSIWPKKMPWTILLLMLSIKPSASKSTTCSTAFYTFAKPHVSIRHICADQGRLPDQTSQHHDTCSA